jgi:hypothetical protein
MIDRSLKCCHCGSIYIASKSAFLRHKKTGNNVYCSRACMPRKGRPRTRPIHKGNCKNCGMLFESVTNKLFCGLKCYTQSNQFKDMLAERAKSRSMKSAHECANCKNEIELKPSRKRKTNFCSQSCYRLYLSNAFDRWIASPQAISLPQCYDEFMCQQSLPCLIDGCDWEGQHLASHAHNVHGITANELKRAAGFNLKTGLIAMPLHLKMCEINKEKGWANIFTMGEHKGNVTGYYSLEGKEHRKKAAMLKSKSYNNLMTANQEDSQP